MSGCAKSTRRLPADVQEYVRAFLQYLQLNRNTSAHTVSAYGSDLAQFVAFAAAHIGKPSAKLRPTDMDLSLIRAFMGDLYRQGQSRSSVARKLSALRGFGRFLRRERLQEAVHPRVRLVDEPV